MARNEQKKVLQQLSEAYQKVINEGGQPAGGIRSFREKPPRMDALAQAAFAKKQDAELPKDWMKQDWESREDSFNADVNLKDEVTEIQGLVDNFLRTPFENFDHDAIAKALHNVKTLLSDITDDGKYSREPSNYPGQPGAQY